MNFEEQKQNMKDLVQETLTDYGEITHEYMVSLIDNLSPHPMRDDIVKKVETYLAIEESKKFDWAIDEPAYIFFVTGKIEAYKHVLSLMESGEDECIKSV